MSIHDPLDTPIPCPACGATDFLGVVQTNGSYALITGRGPVEGSYNFVGMALGPDMQQPPYDDELADKTDSAGHPILRCLNCHHEWADEEGQPS